ncbi:MAG: primosomal protein N' [Clostridia bacterium]|nr:primosomal protein N' [Clostridia bacterium]
MIAEIILNSVTKATDCVYHYEIPSNMQGKIQVGMRVEVQFGNGNRHMEAYVVGLAEHSEYPNLKQISRIIDDTVYFDSEAVKLAEFMHHRYFCSYAQALKTMIPVGVNAKYTKLVFLDETDASALNEACKNSVAATKVVDELKKCSPLTMEQLTSNLGRTNIGQTLKALAGKKIIHTEIQRSFGIKDTVATYVSIGGDITDCWEFCDRFAKTAPAQVRALEMLCDSGTVLLSELAELAGVSKATVDALVQKGYAVYTKAVVRKDLFDSYSVAECERHVLNHEQQHAVDSVSRDLDSDAYSTFLLHGITGSGKTEVYLELIDKTISRGKQAIMLVPEISLTPQMVRRVVSRFPDRVAVIHSSLTLKERFEQWKRIKENDVDVVVGARSAVFAPFDNIGLIIVDEEHENTYKSESAPRYHAVEIARYRARMHNCVLLLASATPSVDSYYKAQSGKYKLLELKHRATEAVLPSVSVVDMRAELECGNMSMFSRELTEAIRQNIQDKKQTILFLNRRGYSSFVSCRSCGYAVKCPHCNVSLTYHKSTDKMMCHYCDYMCDKPTVCPSCGGKYIKLFGTGTQKIAEAVEQLFPEASYLRMDADTTSDRMAHERILNDFCSSDVDILIGTQMITKGLDFENVTLVGVVAADMSLNQEDYRAQERTFDLITQVSGRAGRGKYPGRAIIQTYNPDDETLLLSSRHDYRSFYENEIGFRKMMGYPPFCEFINISFSDKDYNKAKSTAQEFYDSIKQQIEQQELGLYIELFSPTEAPIRRINDKYRFRLLAKSRYNEKLYNALCEVYEKYSKSSKYANIIIDVNP